MLTQMLCVSIGGAVGAGLRFFVSYWVYRRWPSQFPFGTLVVNVVGCFLIGVLMRMSDAGIVSLTARLMLVTGLLGALTTFSTFGFETIRLIEQSEWALALLNVTANVTMSLLAVAVGLFFGKLVWDA